MMSNSCLKIKQLIKSNYPIGTIALSVGRTQSGKRVSQKHESVVFQLLQGKNYLLKKLFPLADSKDLY